MFNKNNLKIILLGFVGAFIFHFLKDNVTPPLQSQSNLASAQTLKVSRIDLVDSQGKLRMQMGFSKEGPPGLWFFDENGVVRLTMGLYPDGTSHFGLLDKNGQMIELMRSTGPEEAPLLIFKNGGADKMIMGLNQNATAPFLRYYDQSLKEKYQFGKSHE